MKRNNKWTVGRTSFLACYQQNAENHNLFHPLTNVGIVSQVSEL